MWVCSLFRSHHRSSLVPRLSPEDEWGAFYARPTRPQGKAWERGYHRSYIIIDNAATV